MVRQKTQKKIGRTLQPFLSTIHLFGFYEMEEKWTRGESNAKGRDDKEEERRVALRDSSINGSKQTRPEVEDEFSLNSWHCF